jgi:predicted regulator of Ras-like GTPase activity (Roadblock/LC7/MglB family)
MPTIRDVVQTLGSRNDVDAVIVLGRDGLTIDAQAGDGLDPDGVSALVPSVVAACNRVGAASGRGEFGTCLIEFGSGMLLVVGLTTDALLAVVFRGGSNIGAQLYEIQRHRSAIAELL